MLTTSAVSRGTYYEYSESWCLLRVQGVVVLTYVCGHGGMELTKCMFVQIKDLFLHSCDKVRSWWRADWFIVCRHTQS